jgi:hypothetical protein
MRVQTKYKPEKAFLPDDIPSYPGFPFKFIAKLVLAKIAMTIGR